MAAGTLQHLVRAPYKAEESWRKENNAQVRIQLGSAYLQCGYRIAYVGNLAVRNVVIDKGFSLRHQRLEQL